MSETETLRQATTAQNRNGTSLSATAVMDDSADKVRRISSRIVEAAADNVAHKHVVAARDADFASLDSPMSDAVAAALRHMGITRLFRHQAEAINLSRSGQNVVVSTPAASGKSLCFNLCVLHALSSDPNARALYIFPTKALAHDQLNGIERMLEPTGAFTFGAYDGDTPREKRAPLRREARLLVTNPDMLHRSTLPTGRRAWRAFLSNLKYVVIDEAHVYRGVFGSHVAMIVRRLRRLCLELGTSPQYILCSATIANPQEHAERLVGLPFHAVTCDGAPSGVKHVILWQNSAQGQPDEQPASVNLEAARIAAQLVSSGLRTMVFARTRAAADSICAIIRDLLKRRGLRIPDAVMPYRAGYEADYRESIERAMKSGALLCMVTTNAMELGIDIAGLDSTVLAGYPGSIASMWQQMWRSGRSASDSLSILVLRQQAVDQFYLRNPDQLFAAPFEQARLSLSNRHVLESHLLCAAHELPLSRRDFNIFGPKTLTRTADAMVREGTLRYNPNRTRSPGPRGAESPAYSMDIRSVGSGSYNMLDATTGKSLETVGLETAWRELYLGAVYMHRGVPHLVVDVDTENLVARVERAPAATYTTRPIVDLALEKLTESRERAIGSGDVAVAATHGWLRVTQRVTGYDKVNYKTGRKLDSVQLQMIAPRVMDTTGTWLTPSRSLDLWQDSAALHAVEHSLLSALHISLMSDASDVAGFVDEAPNAPTIFLYDNRAGGIGVSAGGYEILERVMARALRIISGCDCDTGCPACVISTRCGVDAADPVGGAQLLNGVLRTINSSADPERALRRS